LKRLLKEVWIYKKKVWKGKKKFGKVRKSLERKEKSLTKLSLDEPPNKGRMNTVELLILIRQIIQQYSSSLCLGVHPHFYIWPKYKPLMC
jgi:hypothetical protein